jgi:hypothetical protein
MSPLLRFVGAGHVFSGKIQKAIVIHNMIRYHTIFPQICPPIADLDFLNFLERWKEGCTFCKKMLQS